MSNVVFALLTVRLVLKTVRAAGLKTLWAAWRADRRGADAPDYYTYEKGHYSVEEERQAALKVLHLPPDWIFNERDLARARASLRSLTLQTISFLLDYHYRYDYLKQLERDVNFIPPPPMKIPDLN